jgi:acyl carrier protein
MKETKFLFSDAEFLGIVNIILKVDSDWEEEEYKPITSMDDNFNVQGLDSLSVMMFFIWVSDFFGIPEDKFKELVTKENFTIRTLKDFITKEATKTFTYKDAIAYSRKSFKVDEEFFADSYKKQENP